MKVKYYRTDEDIIQTWLAAIDTTNRKAVIEEIAEVKGSIENEKVWRRGSANGEQRMLHTRNIVCMREYIKTLEHILEGLEGDAT